MTIKIALAGNPNSGKTTLFNRLTGSNQYVGNWPGVTVEKKDGKLKEDKNIIIQDLPGIYSLSPYTMEEVVTRRYLVNEKPDAIINIVDATNLERNLYLTTQLLELGIPVVIALNMIDIVKKNGDAIDTEKLTETMGCKVVKISALKDEGIENLVSEAIDAAKSKETAGDIHVFRGSVEHAIAHIEESIEENVSKDNLRWYAIKIFERDEEAVKEIKISNEVFAHIEDHIKDCENELDDDSESIIINQRYEYISRIIKVILKKKHEGIKVSLSDKIDKIVTNRILALPIFAVVMFLVYYISVTSIGTIVTDFTNDVLVAKWIQPAAAAGLAKLGAAEWLTSLLVDGIIAGLGAPIGFAPQMAIVFLFLSFLEDCGYMARVAFIMDRIFRKFGLSGKSFISFLISSGCGVPGIMSTRTIENERDRRMTMITTTSIPCGAKLPVIAAISGYLAGGIWWMAPLMYFMGIIVVICSAIILKKTKTYSGKPAPFVMELPNYHMPSISSVLLHVWERVWAFLKKAGTILFLCCVVMWFLSSYGFKNGGFGMVDPVDSMMAKLGGALSILFAPLGFGTWQAVASSISGFTAKEAIVSTMGVLSGLGEITSYSASMRAQFSAFFPTTIAAVSFMTFNLFDSPCLAAIATLSKEMGSRKHFWYALLFQNVSAYLLALMIYQLGGLVTGEVTFGIGSIVAIAVALIVLFMLFRPEKKRTNGDLLQGDLA